MTIGGRYAACGRAQAEGFQRDTETAPQSDSATNPGQRAACIARHHAGISP
jgi:hypothetical protein